MAKQPKIKQTDYTIGGRDISNTAIPLYQTNLKRMDEYLADPMAAQNKYLETYYTNTPTQYDFLRDYNQQMAKLTANNYAATTGGYASQNQQNYDQQQRNANDAAARLWNAGVTSAYGMANQDYQNMLAGNQSYNQAYQLGAPYSKIDQYNDMVDQINDNWWANVMTSAGDAIGTQSMNSNNPWVMAIGGAIGGTMGTAGRMFGTDDSALGSLRAAATNYGGGGSGNYGGGGIGSQEQLAQALNTLFANTKQGYNEGGFNFLLPKGLESKGKSSGGK